MIGTIAKRAYVYGRVSHIDQVDQDSLPGQLARGRAYYEFALKPRGIEWGGEEADVFAVSAFKNPFHLRSAGKRLLAKLQPGDHLIFDKPDRIWRRVDDFVDQMRTFRERQITIHFANFMGATVDTSNYMGEFFLTVMVGFAQLEAQQVSARTRDVFQFRRLLGKFPGLPRSFGWRLEGKKTKTSDTRRLVADEAVHEVMDIVYELHELGGMTQYQIADMLEEERCQKLGIDFSTSQFIRQIKADHVSRMYRLKRVLLLWDQVGGFDPNRYKHSEALKKVGSMLTNVGEEAALEEVKRLKADYTRRSSALNLRYKNPDEEESA